MYDKFFGSYLLNKNILTNESLREILEHMQTVRIKVGTLAMKEGLMNGTQVEEVFQLQKVQDKKFGEIAVEKGYLTNDQVERLLEHQSEESNLQLGQAAIDLGYLNYEQLDEELKNFENESGLSKIQLKVLEEGDTDKIIREFIDFKDSPHSQMYYDYVALLLRNVIRFLDQQPWIDVNKKKEELAQNITVYQYLENYSRIFTGISISQDEIIEMAEKFGKMSMKDDMEMAQSAITEFLNLHNGIFTVNMSDQGREYEMSPPAITKEGTIDEMNAGHQIGVNTAIGKIHLILAPY